MSESVEHPFIEILKHKYIHFKINVQEVLQKVLNNRNNPPVAGENRPQSQSQQSSCHPSSTLSTLASCDLWTAN